MNIHLLPGDSYIETFRNSEIGGEVAICRECLIEGDVNADDLASFWLVREKFLDENFGQTGGQDYPEKVFQIH